MSLTPLQLNFDKLPLLETVVRAGFASDQKLTYTIINGMHNELQDVYPRVSEPQHLEFPPGNSAPTSIDDIPSIRGVVFDGDRGLNAALYQNVLVMKWRRSFLPNSKSYPRYATLRTELWRVLQQYRSVTTNLLPITSMNMTYVNFLEEADRSKVIEQYFSDKAQFSFVANADVIRSFDVSWQEDGIDLRVSLNAIQLQKQSGEGIHGYRLTTVAGLILEQPKENASADLDKLHNNLQHLFSNLISDMAREKWGFLK